MAVVVAAGRPRLTLDDAVTEVIVVGRARTAVRRRAEVRWPTHEPEVLHPHLSFAGGDRFYAARRVPARAGVRAVGAPIQSARPSGSCALGLTLVWSAHPAVDVTDRVAVPST